MNLLKKIEDNLVVVLFLAGVVVNLLGIALRFFPSIPQYWVPETYSLLFLTAICIGFGTALRDGRHIVVDIMDRLMNKTAQSITTIISYMISFVFGVLFLVSGYLIVIKTHSQGLTTYDLGLPVWLTYIIIPLAGILILIHLIHLTIKHLKKKEEI